MGNIPNLFGGRDSGTIPLKVPEKKNGPRIDNFMLMNLMEEKVEGVSVRTTQIEESIGAIDY